MSNLYAIVENNTIQRIGRAKALWPQVSFADAGPREDWLLEQGAQQIRYDPPYDPETHDLQPSAPYLLNGVVYAKAAVAKPEPEPEPQWVEFGEVVLFSPPIREFALANPVDYPPLVLGFGQAAQGDSQTLMKLWPAMRQAGIISAELATAVAELAASHNLPADFVAALAPALA
jgi:hypothetical protein